MAFFPRALVIGFGGLVGIGCATVSPSAEFAAVRHVASERVGGELVWPGGGAEDSAVSRRVDSLLGDELTVGRAVQVALLNNRGLRATYEELGIARADLVQAGLLDNPFLNVGARLGLNGIGNGFDVGIVQGFLSVFQRPMRKRVAAEQLERTELEVTDEVLSLAAQTQAAFYRVQGAEQRYELVSTIAEAARLSADIAERQHNAGNISDLDRMTERVLYEQTKLDLEDARANVEEQRARLSALMGLRDSEREWTVGNRLPDVDTAIPNLAALEQQALAERLDLAMARQDIVIAGAAAGIERTAALIPEFDIGVAYERDPGGDREVRPSVGFRIPLFDHGRARNARASARIRQAQNRYVSIAVSIQSDVRQLYAKLRASRAQAAQLRTVILPLRSKIVDETQLHYNGMLVGVFQLLQAKRDQIVAGRQYVDAVERYWTTRAELERVVGGRIDWDGTESVGMSESAEGVQ